MKQTTIDQYTAMGIAALLPGMQAMLDRMQAEVDEMRAQLAVLQGGPVKRKTGRPANTPLPVAPGGEVTARGTPLKAGYWAQFTPEERAAEMRRRREMQKANAAKKGRGKAAANWWVTASERQKKQRLKKMAEGRAVAMAAKVPSVRMSRVNGAAA